MAIFSKIIEDGRIVICDKTFDWHINNQTDENKYLVVRSEMSSKNTDWLNKINHLIKLGYEPIGGVSSDHGYLYQALYRKS